MGVGLRLKAILRDKKMTIKQLSEEAEISLNTLYSITKRDSERVDPVILQRIADTLGINISYLLGVEDINGVLSLDNFADPDDYEFIKALGFHDPQRRNELLAKPVYQINFDTTPDPEWASLYHKLETGTITPDELQRWKDIQATASANMHKALFAMQERLRKYMDLLNTAGQEEAIKRIEELTEIPKYQKNEKTPEDQ